MPSRASDRGLHDNIINSTDHKMAEWLSCDLIWARRGMISLKNGKLWPRSISLFMRPSYSGLKKHTSIHPWCGKMLA